MNSILKKEINALDRQYSYEHTVQLGRYRLDFEEDEKTNTDRLEVNLPTEEAGDTLPRKTTRVRFHEHDPREDWKEERNAPSWEMVMKRWLLQCRSVFSWSSLRMLLMDWLFLAILGIGMALTSMFMDNVIEYLQTFQLVLMNKSGQTGNPYLDYLCTYLSWLGYTELLVICSAMIVHYLAPQAIGSGIPEMKTILRGVVLKDFLTLRTLISKTVGLTFALGSGIPIGKMGPFVHVASIAANLLSNLAAQVDGAYGNECRKSEMLAAACATGVACTFSSPVGGVLFSIEVTTMYFSVRNYWRGFFAAACGATVFRLVRVVAFKAEVTLVAFYQTHFPQDAFEPEELPFFALLGLFSGLLGAGFILFYKNAVMFLRQNPIAKKFFQTNWIVYPTVIAFLVATVTYPRGFGRFLSGRYKFTQTVLDFFSNCTWSKPLHSPESPHGCSSELLATWTNHEGYGPYNVFLVLCVFAFTFLFLAALCNTMPIPCGMFMPMFVVGAAFGRLMGEIIAVIFPDGIPGGTDQPIFPGIYAVVGAAALTGAITHSVSVAMICCEITGQLIYIIPLMIAVIIANAVCTYFQPSVYDVMIKIKHLPYLPDLPPANAAVHTYNAEHIMVSHVRHLCRLTTYAEIRNILVDMPKVRSFPVVDDPSSMMLLGSVPRRTLLEMLSKQIGDDARKKEAERRIRSAIETIDRHFREAQEQQAQRSISNQSNERNKSSEERLDFSDHNSDHEKLPDDDKELYQLDKSEDDPVRPEKRFRKTSINLPAEAKHTVKRVSLLEPPASISRTRSESAIAKRYRIKGKIDENMLHGMPGADLGDHPIQILAKPRKRKNRFQVEPVIQPYNHYHCVNSTGKDSIYANAAKKISKNLSTHSLKSSKDQPQPRARRNAVASSVSMQGKIDDEDSPSQHTSGASTPTRKSSGTESRYYYDHQASMTRNISDYVKQAKKRLLFMQSRHKASMEKMEYDLFEEERREWELSRLEEAVEFQEKQIDPAPFQLVRKTSVYKVHSLFSLLDLNRAYVTDRGRLVGVVALRDLRIAIQNAQNGVPLDLVHSADSSTNSQPFASEQTTTTSADANGDLSVAAKGDFADLESGKSQGRDSSPKAEKWAPLGTIDGDLKQTEVSDDFNQRPSASVSPALYERNRHESNESVHDVLTPTIKIVHPSSASLHHFTNHPIMLTIQEEIEPVGVSRKSSLKSSRNSSLRRSDSSGTGAIAGTSVIPLIESAASELRDSATLSPEPGDVIQAVAYLRRKSVAVEDLLALEETQIPDRKYDE